MENDFTTRELETADITPDKTLIEKQTLLADADDLRAEDPDYNPQLDPNSPLFDMDTYRKALVRGAEETVKGLEMSFEAAELKIQESILAAITRLTPTSAANTLKTVEAIRDTTAAIISTAKYAFKAVAYAVDDDHYRAAIKENTDTLASSVERYKAEVDFFMSAAKEIQALAPFLSAELEELRKDPAFAGCSVEDLLDKEFDEDGNPVASSPFRQAIERAMKRKADAPRITLNPASGQTDFPLDKPNSLIWSLPMEADDNGKLPLMISTASEAEKKQGKEALVYYEIFFNAIEMQGSGITVTKELTPYDRRVYIEADGLFNDGNDTFSVTQIYKRMYGRDNPNPDDLQKINDSLTKMGTARVYLDSSKEVQLHRGYKSFRYDAALLPFERLDAYIDGQLCTAIHLFREPPLMTFARGRNQITSFPRKVLASPVSKTNANLRIDDYLIERISHMKNNKKLSRKILYTTIYERCQITAKKQKQRAPEKIRRYMDHYKKSGFIKGYTEDKDGITVQV